MSHHIKALKHAGLVTARKEGKMTRFALTPVGCALVEIAAALAADATGAP